MTDNPAGEKTPRTNARPTRSMPKIKVGSVAGFLAVVPHLLGFHPDRSLVVVGLDSAHGRIILAFRYNLPDPPDPVRAGEIAGHAAAVLGQRGAATAIAAGYGPGALVTPVAAPLRAALQTAGITVRDLLRVEDGRYWSYVCQDPGCCPPDGVAFDGPAHPAAAALTAAGLDALPGRASLAAALTPVIGAAAEAMNQATERALRRAEELAAPAPSREDATRLVVDAGRAAVREAIGVYRGGGRITDDDRLAWLAVMLADLRVRDDAWARMEPRHRAAHRRLWTDLVRRARDPYVPAPASLLAFTAWQSGEGALANVAIERALAADPGYSMAHLLGQAVDAGLPPSAARLPMTPEEVEASYAVTERARAGAPSSAAAPASRPGSSSRRRPAGRSPARRPRGRSSPRGPAGRSSAGRSPGGGSPARRSPARPASSRPSG
jgi:Domain of unknown function (DUF4192)